MELGVVLPHNEIGTDPSAMRDFAQAAEGMGYKHMLIYDHVLGADPDRPGGWEGRPYDKDVAFHEPLTTFAFLAAVTKTMGFMSTVMILPQRQAALVAKQVAQVAILSENRLRLGIGTGWNTVEYEALNVPYANRGKRQEEQVELIQRLLTEDSFSFNGRFHTVDKAGINPRPSEHVPVWFGGAAPAVLERTARMGDGWIPLMGPNDAAKGCIETLHSLRQAAGKSEGFGIQAQAQFAGGNPDRWQKHKGKWEALGCTHLAVASHGAGNKSPDGHIDAIRQYMEAVS